MPLPHLIPKKHKSSEGSSQRGTNSNKTITNAWLAQHERYRTIIIDNLHRQQKKYNVNNDVVTDRNSKAIVMHEKNKHYAIKTSSWQGNQTMKFCTTAKVQVTLNYLVHYWSLY